MIFAIRDAAPADARFLAWAMQESGRSHLPRGTWDVLLPGPEVPRLDLLAALATAPAPSFCHYRGFLVAELDASPVATLCGYQPGVATSDLFLEALRQAGDAMGWSRGRMRELLTRFGPFATCATDPDDDAWVVEWVATRPEHRGRGHARRLLDALLERGRQRGLRRAHLGVLIGNDAAQKLYERAGFEVVAEKRHPDFEAVMGTPGVRVLERPLEAPGASG